MMEKQEFLAGELIDEQTELSIGEVCRCCHLSAEQLIGIVEIGVVEPRGQGPQQWIFHGPQIQRIERFMRLKRDLGVNDAGAALAIELLDELARLRQCLQRLGG